MKQAGKVRVWHFAGLTQTAGHCGFPYWGGSSSFKSAPRINRG